MPIMNRAGWTRSVVMLSGVVLAASTARAAVLPAAPVTVALPLPSPNSFDVAVVFGPSDGLLYVWNGASVLKQNAIDSSSFTSIGLVGSGSADPGPIAFSRGAGALLLGNGSGGFVPSGNANLIFSIPAAGGDSSTAVGDVPFHYSFLATPTGAPPDTYFVDQGDASFTGSSVSIFDASSGTNVPVVQNIPGASASMALDAAGRLYVGIGFGAQRGELRRFAFADLDNAYNVHTPLGWTSGELFNAFDNNSGAGMFVDARGYLFVGGPDGITVFDQGGNFRLYENGGFTSVDYDPVSDRFLARGFGNEQGIYPAAVFLVPEPATAVLAILSGVLFIPLAWRMRRRSAIHQIVTG